MKKCIIYLLFLVSACTMCAAGDARPSSSQSTTTPERTRSNLPSLSAQSVQQLHGHLAWLYDRKGWFKEAAKAYEKAGDRAKAQELWRKEAEQMENAQIFNLAEDAYEKAGDRVKAQEMLRQAAEQQERKGDFKLAGWFYKRLGNMTKAREVSRRGGLKYEKEKRFEDAALSYEILGNVPKVQEMWMREVEKAERQENFYKAAVIYERLGDVVKAQDMLMREADKQENLQSFKHAAEAYEKSGDTTKAKDMWRRRAEESEKEELFYYAAKAYEKVGDENYALLFYNLFVLFHQKRIDLEVRALLNQKDYAGLVSLLYDRELISEKEHSLFFDNKKYFVQKALEEYAEKYLVQGNFVLASKYYTQAEMRDEARVLDVFGSYSFSNEIKNTLQAFDFVNGIRAMLDSGLIAHDSDDFIELDRLYKKFSVLFLRARHDYEKSAGYNEALGLYEDALRDFDKTITQYTVQDDTENVERVTNQMKEALKKYEKYFLDAGRANELLFYYEKYGTEDDVRRLSLQQAHILEKRKDYAGAGYYLEEYDPIKYNILMSKAADEARESDDELLGVLYGAHIRTIYRQAGPSTDQILAEAHRNVELGNYHLAQIAYQVLGMEKEAAAMEAKIKEGKEKQEFVYRPGDARGGGSSDDAFRVVETENFDEQKDIDLDAVLAAQARDARISEQRALAQADQELRRAGL